MDPLQLLYHPYSSRDEVAKPFCYLREELEKAGYLVKVTTTGKVRRRNSRHRAQRHTRHPQKPRLRSQETAF